MHCKYAEQFTNALCVGCRYPNEPAPDAIEKSRIALGFMDEDESWSMADWIRAFENVQRWQQASQEVWNENMRISSGSTSSALPIQGVLVGLASTADLSKVHSAAKKFKDAATMNCSVKLSVHNKMCSNAEEDRVSGFRWHGLSF